MIKKVKCLECGTKHVVNPEKHKYRPKLCTKCRSVIDNASPKRRVSLFQRGKAERKSETRKRFVERMTRFKYTMEQIAKKMTKIFEWEKQ